MCIRDRYAVLITVFLLGIFKKRSYGYFAIQTYNFLVCMNAIASVIGLLKQPKYFSDFYAAKAAQLTGIEPAMPNVAYYSSLASSIGIILFSAWLISAFRRRKEHFQ